MKKSITENKLRNKIHEMVSCELKKILKEGVSDSEEEVLRNIYQHLCDCQDLSESIGQWGLYDTFENLRREVDRIRFS